MNVPVYQLLGGRVRERVPLTWTIAYRSLEEQVLEARSRVEEGFTNVLKMKVGVPGDLERVLRVAEIAGDVPIRPDSNQGHDKETAIRQTKELRAHGVNIELLEDPSPSDWDDYQEIADATGVGISVHAGWSSLADLAGIIRANKPGIRCVNIMPTRWGIRRTAQIAGALEYAGIGWTMGTSHDSAIKIAASLHLATAVSNRMYPVDLLGAVAASHERRQESADTRRWLRRCHRRTRPGFGPGRRRPRTIRRGQWERVLSATTLDGALRPTRNLAAPLVSV